MTPKQIEKELTAKGNNLLLDKIRCDIFYIALMVFSFVIVAWTIIITYWPDNLMTLYIIHPIVDFLVYKTFLIKNKPYAFFGWGFRIGIDGVRYSPSCCDPCQPIRIDDSDTNWMCLRLSKFNLPLLFQTSSLK